ncbi:hypothetical protein HAX54_013701 [Datura stramonium]|uniref:Uncharacterized protein n=1 Tax=Datura stramonium TaxID=4076 RepID=A0ABS8RYF8_DATST|nr:hypothetical protein [Datura stramonium]
MANDMHATSQNLRFASALQKKTRSHGSGHACHKSALAFHRRPCEEEFKDCCTYIYMHAAEVLTYETRVLHKYRRLPLKEKFSKDNYILGKLPKILGCVQVIYVDFYPIC